MASHHVRALFALRARVPAPRIRPAAALRPYHATASQRLPYKDTQDRESLNPSAQEGTKTGRDADVAANNPDAAFNPKKTSPEAAKETAGQELDVSGANQEVQKPQGDERAPRKQDQEVRKGGTSQGGSPAKKGTPAP